jgi:hypothetical protein
MTVIDRLKQIISLFEIYDVESNKYLRGELEAFALGIEILQNLLFGMERECFVATAVDYGLTEKEKIFGSPKSERAAYDRRNMIISALACNGNNFTLQGMNNYLNTFPSTHDIYETPTKNTITINFENNDWVRSNIAYITKSVTKFFPAHLDVVVSATGLMWTEAENKIDTFDDFDNKNLTWSQIEALQ